LLWHACPKRRLHRAVVFVARADTSHNRDCLYGTCHELSHHNIPGFILEYLRHVLCEQGGLVFPTITYRRSIKNVLDSKSLLCRATRRLLCTNTQFITVTDRCRLSRVRERRCSLRRKGYLPLTLSAQLAHTRKRSVARGRRAQETDVKKHTRSLSSRAHKPAIAASTRS
jgi:hypothetical protein